MGDNGADGDTACDAELVLNHDLLFVDGTFGCSTTRNVTITCTWNANHDIAGDNTGASTAVFTGAEAVLGAKCEVEVN